MNKTIENISEINTQLEQFKTSIEVLINQNNEYINGIKRYSNKKFIIEKKESDTLEQRKNKADTMLDQLEDITSRTDLIIQNIDKFEKKFEEAKIIVNDLKIKCKEKRICTFPGK